MPLNTCECCHPLHAQVFVEVLTTFCGAEQAAKDAAAARAQEASLNARIAHLQVSHLHGLFLVSLPPCCIFFCQ